MWCCNGCCRVLHSLRRLRDLGLVGSLVMAVLHNTWRMSLYQLLWHGRVHQDNTFSVHRVSLCEYTSRSLSSTTATMFRRNNCVTAYPSGRLIFLIAASCIYKNWPSGTGNFSFPSYLKHGPKNSRNPIIIKIKHQKQLPGMKMRTFVLGNFFFLLFRLFWLLRSSVQQDWLFDMANVVRAGIKTWLRRDWKVWNELPTCFMLEWQV